MVTLIRKSVSYDGEMHKDNGLFQALIGKTVSRVEYVDDYSEGITLHFTDGSMLNVYERMQAGQIAIAADLNVEKF